MLRLGRKTLGHRAAANFAIACGLMLAAFAGCDNGPATKDNGKGGSSTNSSTSSSETGGKGDGSAKRIILLNNNDSEFWTAARAGIKSANEKLHLADANITALMEINDGTLEGQIQKLRQFSTQSDVIGVGISVLDPNNPQLIEEMRKLRAKGIPVLCFDSDVDRAKYRDARSYFVGTDNLEGGKLLGDVAKHLKPDGTEYAQFVGRKSAQNAQDRMNGFTETAGEKSKEVGRWEDDTDRGRAMDNVKIAINKNPDLGMLVGIWSYNAPAIVKVVDEMKKPEISVVAFDAEAPAISACAAGKIQAMVVQNPFEMGFQSIRILKALVDKDEKGLKEMFPNADKPDGDFYNTGLRIVVPEKSPLKKDMFTGKADFYTAPEFQKWLAERNITSS
jgi:ribose transport system substrate-binding protein